MLTYLREQHNSKIKMQTHQGENTPLYKAPCERTLLVTLLPTLVTEIRMVFAGDRNRNREYWWSLYLNPRSCDFEL